MSTGILGLSFADAPIAVIDFETTGLSADSERVVEVSVVRVEEGGMKRTLVLDTLVNPRRRVSGTEIHGITDRMVENAPEFRDIWPSLHAALAGCVVAAYNAYFDMRFLTAEACRAGEDVQVPYFCLMYMRPLIGVGERCKLSAACRHQGIRLTAAHRSARDAMATAELLPGYIQAMRANGLKTYQDLRSAGSHKYLQSFALQPLTARSPQHHCELVTRELAESLIARRSKDSPIARRSKDSPIARRSKDSLTARRSKAAAIARRSKAAATASRSEYSLIASRSEDSLIASRSEGSRIVSELLDSLIPRERPKSLFARICDALGLT